MQGVPSVLYPLEGQQIVGKEYFLYACENDENMDDPLETCALIKTIIIINNDNKFLRISEPIHENI